MPFGSIFMYFDEKQTAFSKMESLVLTHIQWWNFFVIWFNCEITKALLVSKNKIIVLTKKNVKHQRKSYQTDSKIQTNEHTSKTHVCISRLLHWYYFEVYPIQFISAFVLGIRAMNFCIKISVSWDDALIICMNQILKKYHKLKKIIILDLLHGFIASVVEKPCNVLFKCETVF